MSIKLAIRISDMGAAVHIGGDVEVMTHIVEVENDELERLLNPFIKGQQWQTHSISLVRETFKEKEQNELADIIKDLTAPMAEGHKTRIEGEFKIIDQAFNFKAYVVFSRAKGAPSDLFRIDISPKGE